MSQYRYARVILCTIGDVYIFELKCCISALGHVRVLILSNTTNVKNMHLHWDSNPGPWNTVPML